MSSIIGNPSQLLLTPPNLSAVGSVLLGIVEGSPNSMLGVRVDAGGRLLVSTTGGSGDVALSDAINPPAAVLGTGSFTLAFDRAATRWARVDRDDLTSSAAIPVASMGSALKVSAATKGYNYATNQYRIIGVDSNGSQYVIPTSTFVLADNANLMGGVFAVSDSIALHRNQGGNFYATRGGYNSAIGAADIPGILNSIATLAYNSSPPAVVSSQAVAAQSDSRGTLLVQLAKPDGTSRDTPTRASAVGAVAASLKASAGNLLSLTAHLAEKGEIAVWLLLLDQTTAPVNGQAPVWSEFVPPITGDEGPSSFYEPTRLGREIFSEQGLRFSTGIAACFSTTPNVVTLIGATANAAFNATYV